MYPSHAPPEEMRLISHGVGSVPNVLSKNAVGSAVGSAVGTTEKLGCIWADAQGEVCLYEMVSWLSEQLADMEENAILVQEENDRLKALELVAEEQATMTAVGRERHPAPTQFGRRCIYSHHIIAQSKRVAVVKTAIQLGLSGISKIGWPGVIVVEGEENNVKEYVRYLSGLRWKQLTVRGEEVIDMSPTDTIESLRAFPKGFQEFGEKEMSLAAAACRDVGLEALFKTAMKIYSSTSSDK